MTLLTVFYAITGLSRITPFPPQFPSDTFFTFNFFRVPRSSWTNNYLCSDKWCMMVKNSRHVQLRVVLINFRAYSISSVLSVIIGDSLMSLTNESILIALILRDFPTPFRNDGFSKLSSQVKTWNDQI